MHTLAVFAQCSPHSNRREWTCYPTTGRVADIITRGFMLCDTTGEKFNSSKAKSKEVSIVLNSRGGC